MKLIKFVKLEGKSKKRPVGVWFNVKSYQGKKDVLLKNEPIGLSNAKHLIDAWFFSSYVGIKTHDFRPRELKPPNS